MTRVTRVTGTGGVSLRGTLRLTWVTDHLEHCEAGEASGTWTGTPGLRLPRPCLGELMHQLGYALMAIGAVLFWGAVIFGVVALARHGRRAGPRLPESAEPLPPGPERLLAERFARGEIDEDEYYQRLTTLRAADPAAAR